MSKAGRDNDESGTGSSGLRRRLEELLSALERRVRQPQRSGEARIAEDAESLRRSAQARLDTLP
jgi:hypothetical protein